MKDKMFAVTQTGISHLRADTGRRFSPCQDAVRIVKFPGKKLTKRKLNGTIIVLADGHGNPVYHGSSEFGSKLGVDSGVDCMLELVAEYEKCQNPDVFLKFPQMVVDTWRTRVLEHAKGRFPEKDLRSRFRNEKAYEDYENRIVMDYGSTLLSVAAIPEKKLLVAAQIGDGDILMMSKNEGKSDLCRLVRGKPESEFGSNRTDSLCMKDAVQKFQIKILDGNKDEDALKMLKDYVIMIATDGISSAAISEDKFLYEYCWPRMKGYMDASCRESYKQIQEMIEDEMANELCYYSADDMTVVFMAVNEERG